MDDTSTAARAPRPPSTASDAPGEPLHPDAVEHVVVQLRPVASPTSVGLFGLAAASFVLGGLQLGWVRPEERAHVGVVLIGFAAGAQLVASLVAFSCPGRSRRHGHGRPGAHLAVDRPGAAHLDPGIALRGPRSSPGVQRRGRRHHRCHGVAHQARGCRRVPHGGSAARADERLRALGSLLAGDRGRGRGSRPVGPCPAGCLGVRGRGGPRSSPLPLGRRGKGEDAMRASFAEQTRDVATEAGVRLRL